MENLTSQVLNLHKAENDEHDRNMFVMQDKHDSSQRSQEHNLKLPPNGGDYLSLEK